MITVAQAGECILPSFHLLLSFLNRGCSNLNRAPQLRLSPEARAPLDADKFVGGRVRFRFHKTIISSRELMYTAPTPAIFSGVATTGVSRYALFYTSNAYLLLVHFRYYPVH